MWLDIALWSAAGIAGLCLMVAAIKSRRPVRSLLSSGTQGLCALGLVNLLGGLTGVSLGTGWLAVGAGFFLGIPGVIALLVLRALFLTA